MKYFTKEVQIGLVTLVGLVLLFFGMNFLKGLSMLSASNTYMAKFSDVTGLTASSPVYCNGVKVGTVETIKYDYVRLEVVQDSFRVCRQDAASPIRTAQ